MPTSIMRQKFAGSSGPLKLASGRAFVAVLQARLVAMVAVGDEDGAVGHQALHGGVNFLVEDGPQAVDDAQVVDRFQGRVVLDAGLDGSLNVAIGVGVEAEDGAQVKAGGVVKGESVGLGAGEGLFVWEDAALADGFQANPRQESATGVALALDVVGLVVNIEGGVIFLRGARLA